MKIQIDTTNKVIRVEEKVNLGTLYEYLRKWLPNGGWKKFSIDAHTTIEWKPIYPYYPVYIDRPYNPYVPWITWYGSDTVKFDDYDNGTTGRTFELNNGTYNVEILATTEIGAVNN